MKFFRPYLICHIMSNNIFIEHFMHFYRLTQVSNDHSQIQSPLFRLLTTTETHRMRIWRVGGNCSQSNYKAGRSSLSLSPPPVHLHKCAIITCCFATPRSDLRSVYAWVHVCVYVYMCVCVCVWSCDSAGLFQASFNHMFVTSVQSGEKSISKGAIKIETMGAKASQ